MELIITDTIAEIFKSCISTLVEKSYFLIKFQQYKHCNLLLIQGDGRRKSRHFWVRLRSGSTVGQAQSKPPLTTTREAANNWSVDEVVTWLETMQLSEYVESFMKNDIRGKELLTLGRRDLKDLGVVKVGHVKRILQAIKDMNDN